MIQLIKDSYAHTKLIGNFFGNNNINLHYVQNGREYTSHLDSKITAKLQEIKNNGKMNTFSYILKKNLNGSKINLQISFTDTSFTKNYTLELQDKGASLVIRFIFLNYRINFVFIYNLTLDI